ncbi:MAG: hypothetical protein U5N86_06580 [Planctomycetota bacterium]|nr:hypothetical protein [Planctomycetota bacterium]
MVANHDVFDESLEVRKRLGYLPENVPLYTEMRVREFLRYRAALKKIPGFERSAHVDKVVAVLAGGCRRPHYRPPFQGLSPEGRSR